MIVDLEKAKRQIGLFNPDSDDRVVTAVAAAQIAVFNYIERDQQVAWLDDSTGVYDVPADIGHAILMCVENLYNDAIADPISPGVRSLLERYRDPAVA